MPFEKIKIVNYKDLYYFIYFVLEKIMYIIIFLSCIIKKIELKFILSNAHI